jgi:hypothetical protein
VGEIIGSKGANSKKFYEGDRMFKAGEYDVIFDV